LQDQEQDLIDQDRHNDEDEAHVVVHGYRRRQEDDQGDDKHTEVKLLDLEVVLVISLPQDVVLYSLEHSQKRTAHLEDKLIEGAEYRVQDKDVEGGEE
jgi:hypothetical protein